MGWALRALAERDETEDQLRLLFEKTQRDPTPQERRALAREIALLIPDENEGIMQGRPDPLWLQFLRTFARRELELDHPAQDSRRPDVGGAEARALGARVREAVGDMIDEVGEGHRVAMNQEHAGAVGARTPSKLPSSGGKGGRPVISLAKARRQLLAATKRFREGRDETEPLTNVGLAKAIRRNEETISNWLRRAEWTLDDLDVEWTLLRPKKPE